MQLFLCLKCPLKTGNWNWLLMGNSVNFIQVLLLKFCKTVYLFVLWYFWSTLYFSMDFKKILLRKFTSKTIYAVKTQRWKWSKLKLKSRKYRKIICNKNSEYQILHFYHPSCIPQSTTSLSLGCTSGSDPPFFP